MIILKEFKHMTLEEFRAAAASDTNSKPLDRPSFLIMGQQGTGKTSMLVTGKLPVLIYSFDPSSLMSPQVREAISKGHVLIKTYWTELSTTPRAYAAFEKDFQQDIFSGFANHFGTIAIDSCTTMMQAAANYLIAKLNAEDPKRQGRYQLQIQDYNILYALIYDITKIVQSSTTADFIMTGHLELDKDESSGQIVALLHTFNKLRFSLPTLFTEKYVLIKRGDKPKVLTQNSGFYQASTQIGGGIFAAEEEPNLKALFKKAGLSASDKEESIQIIKSLNTK